MRLEKTLGPSAAAQTVVHSCSCIIVIIISRINVKCNQDKCNNYGKWNLWEMLFMSSVTYSKCIMASVVMKNVLRQMKLSQVIWVNNEQMWIQAFFRQ